MTHDQMETLLDLLTDIKFDIGIIAKRLGELSATKKETTDANAL